MASPLSLASGTYSESPTIFLYTFEITKKGEITNCHFHQPTLLTSQSLSAGNVPRQVILHLIVLVFEFDVVTLAREFVEDWLTKRGQDASLEDATAYEDSHVCYSVIIGQTVVYSPKIVPSLSTLRVSEVRPNTLGSWSLPSTEPLTSRYRMSITLSLVHSRLTIYN